MGKQTVLIVDDHAILRRLLRSNLQEWFDGLEILEAEDGETAVAIAEEARPDLVIMDIALPGMNGIEATRAIKQSLPETPVIILTVHELDAYRNDAEDAGADAYIPKRHMQLQLSAALAGFFGRPPASAGNAA
jgi:DNA-binding NarL/FixJ family response regulator